MKQVLSGLIAAVLLAAAPLASAGTLEIGDVVTVADNAGGLFGPGYAPQSLTITIDGAAHAIDVGMFVLNYQHTGEESWTEFLSFCMNAERALTPFVNPYTVETVAGEGFTAQISNDVAELWFLARGQVTSSTSAAAFQLALWEIAFGSTDYDLSAGDFRVGAGDATTLAQGWLNTVNNGTGELATNLALLVSSDETKQRMLTSVPEPATLGLLGLGLLGLGFGGKKRRA